MLDTILQYLRTPFVVLSGTPVTALTILTAIAIVFAARIIAAVVGRSVERLLESRDLDTGMRFAANKRRVGSIPSTASTTLRSTSA
ncbi:hypothetical protein BH11MYX1_BH11MYX1_55130 [soil metagenome]